MSLKNKLDRLKSHLSSGSTPEKRDQPSVTPGMEVPFREKWEQENVYPFFIDDHYCLIREVKYPLSHQHGNYCFRDFLTAVDLWNHQPLSHPLSAKGHQAEELFFFDTETTGLGGGVGNTIFILGYASVFGDHLVLRQHILPHPGGEVPLYQSFLEKVNYRTLVTYNGKSFDWPQVKTRHTLIREHVPKLPEFGHFDLFHAARRLWKHKLDRMKLAIVEKEVLGVERIDDIPGFLAPMIYFDFIESKKPDGMLGLLKHNEIDILSLVTLYSHLTFQLYGIDHNQTRAETYEVGRWFATLGENKEAEQVLSKLTNGRDMTSYQAKYILAFQQKKEQNWESARTLFLEMIDSSETQMRVEALLELAKIHEHRLIDYKLAIVYCQKAIEQITQSKTTAKWKRHITLEQFEKRLKRLERKYVTKS
ncbi:ribonuclease H-like domain-containing protein [Neobacillus sp. OS1-2]|uniref:ribonuclease H-like domain-containing protein n=1 Tax=Neobacillus sp. OS1-2 TaxID=3070680 RepID=UPI0027DF2DDB|nr:ribonuclease H-like domain-containing protein [Neobacillus sp. OS1-2]WML40328.1 ribonuclease H-like domain-containing protein [Neobacillus sp. OS1-2]